MVELDHVSRRVLADIHAGNKPSKAYSQAMASWYSYNAEDNPKPERAAKIAFTIHGSSRQSEIMEALLLSNCPYEVIEESLEVPRAATGIYAELFFDTSVFNTKLDRLEYLEEYPDAWGKDLKIKAVNLGYEFVLFNFANLVPKNIAQKKLIERMFMSTAYKAMAMNYNGIKSDVTSRAIKHAELMLRAYDALAKANAGEVASTHDLTALLAKDCADIVKSSDTIGDII